MVADLAGSFEDIDPADMVAASDGSLWVLESGRGRVIRVDPADGSTAIIYRAGQELDSGDDRRANRGSSRPPRPTSSSSTASESPGAST